MGFDGRVVTPDKKEREASSHPLKGRFGHTMTEVLPPFYYSGGNASFWIKGAPNKRSNSPQTPLTVLNLWSLFSITSSEFTYLEGWIKHTSLLMIYSFYALCIAKWKSTSSNSYSLALLKILPNHRSPFGSLILISSLSMRRSSGLVADLVLVQATQLLLSINGISWSTEGRISQYSKSNKNQDSMTCTY